MLVDRSRAVGAASAGALGREQVATMLASMPVGVALNAVGELDEMAVESDQITRDESDLLQAESLAARSLDEDLAVGLRHRRLGGETSAAGYLRDLSDRPRLPAGVERRLIDAAQAGDRRAREELVEAFLPLIAGVARVYRGSRTITRLELMQEGVVGLLRALERFDPEVGVPFWGYAAWWVRHAMQQLIAELTRPLVLSDRALRQLSQLRRAHGDYLAEHGREPSGNELAVGTGLTHEQVGEMLALERVPQSMDEPVQGAEGELGAFGELLADPLAADAYEQLLDHSEIEQIRALLSSLNDRERMILRARYGLEGPEQSLRDVGERIGLSGERVRQIEQRALGKLRAAADRGERD
ncbi:MAG TPA: sigma-70 family RNA polymerase sigma factor [Solirubrobacteraceae bacterium]|nr:sigma-70 family RNA polymerase sigma factor [Solirubrobacteraceae bacterium]